MAEEMKRTEFEFTYTYDQFTVFFYGDRVFVGKQEYPIGQCCMDILNLDEAVFDEIARRVRELVPAARDLLTEKTDSAAALAQERLNAVWELIFALPVYRNLKMDEPCNYHTFQRLMADKEKWAQVQDPASTGYAKYQGMLMELISFAERLRGLRQLIDMMVDKCLEPLKHRNRSAYAEVYSYFYMQMLSAGVQIF
ncbi:hypothetical protein [Dysosmobacter sp.]|uniref:hypothetical protein n=1 Tax=Dysosmobacter sp. TaxID=2591382 RepID=UPI002A871866|nr:hypothetical protein [Dysosmobacter sp.]MDY3984581.1 hypothetical protein [Dysosmobacter sp.]